MPHLIWGFFRRLASAALLLLPARSSCALDRAPDYLSSLRAAGWAKLEAAVPTHCAPLVDENILFMASDKVIPQNLLLQRAIARFLDRQQQQA